MRTRLVKLAMGLLAVAGLHAAPDMAWAASPQRMAMGLIVKLKEGGSAASVVRLQASKRPSDTPEHIRLRLAKVAHDRGVGYLISKPTAFAAQVIHSGHPEPLADAQAKAARLRADPNVEWVIVNDMLSSSTVTGVSVSAPTNDPDYNAQTWIHPRNAGSGYAAVADIPAAWALLAGRALTPVVVAVLDTGILMPSEMQGRVLPGYDFVSELEYSRDGSGLDADPSDPGDWLTDQERNANLTLYGNPCTAHDSNWHGLAVSSMLAAATDNADFGAGILAPLPGAVLLPVRVSGICGASVSDVIEGMLWAAGVDYQGSPARNANPARVINLSFGGDGSCAEQTVGSTGWLYRQTVGLLNNLGVVVVASAGNGDANGVGLPTLTRPANCPGVLAVTGLNMAGYKANYANLVDVGKDYAVAVATGDGIYNPGSRTWAFADDGIATMVNTGHTTPEPTYTFAALLGTSFGAPTAAGVAALMLAANPNLTVNQVLSALTTRVEPFPSTSRPVCNPSDVNARGQCDCTTSTCGGGMLDAARAVQWAIDRLGDTGVTPYSYAQASANYFRPERVSAASDGQQNASSGGGGGGAMDLSSLLVLSLALIVVLAARFRGGRP